MKKKMLRKLFSMAISVAITASTLATLGVVSFAEEETVIPDPVAVYDFSYNFEELAQMNEGFEVVENDAAPTLVDDKEMGQVLKLGKTIIGEREFAKKGEEDTLYIISDTSQYSTINIANPFKGLYHLKEYEPWEDVKLKIYRNCEQPYWTEGITISYWIKTPADESGYGVNSNVVGFHSNRFQMQADDYAKYLSTVIYNRDFNSYTEAEKELLDISFAGVDRSSAFYIELAEEETYKGEPLYTDPENMGSLYWMNPNYEEGYILYNDGTIGATPRAAGDDAYRIPPYLGDTEDDHDPGESIIRYAWTYSEMWLDASSSFYFENDTDNVNPQLNPNNVTTFGTKAGMQNNDCFNINSWKSANTYLEAGQNKTAADSPVTNPDEWHNVTCVIQNDWVLYYLDGEEIDVEENYSSFGGNGLAVVTGNYKPWKRFNKGAGSRYGYGNNKVDTYWCAYGNYVATTMMEWIVKDCVKTTIGGGNKAGDGYLMYADTDEIMLKNVVFYDKMLDEDQIERLAEEPFIYDKNGVPVDENLLGDVNDDGSINAADALAVLKDAAKMEAIEESKRVVADVNKDGDINAADALLILKLAAHLIDSFE